MSQQTEITKFYFSPEIATIFQEEQNIDNTIFKVTLNFIDQSAYTADPIAFFCLGLMHVRQ